VLHGEVEETTAVDADAMTRKVELAVEALQVTWLGWQALVPLADGAR
jgi:hypothetical protein